VRDASSLDRLIALSYRAARDPTGWHPLLTAVTTEFEATAVGFVFYSRDCTSSSVSIYCGIEEQAISEYAAHFASINDWMRHGGSKLRTGTVFANEELCPRDVLRRGEFYNDWVSRYDVAEGFGACLFAEAGLSTGLTVLRSERHPYGAAQRTLLTRLLPHLQCATLAHRTLAAAESRARAERQALDALPIGVVTVDANARVLMTNRYADAILRANDGISAPASAITAATTAETAALRALIAAASAIHHRRGVDAPGVLRVSRPSLRRPLVIQALPIAAMADLHGDAAAASVILLITDPDGPAAGNEQLLREGWGLTPAEARAAALIASGMGTAAVAAMLKISIETLRRHIKRACRKTGTHGQADLVALVARGPAA
jgi:DNA-binding CsgD family transcriptional regulator